MMQGMPLSEDEQRILRQIEQELQQDPSFSERGYRVSRRRLLLLSVGLVVGLVLTVLGLAVSFWLAFVAFLCVLGLAVMLETEIRVVGREKLGNLPINAWLAGSGRQQQRKPE
jgi:Flp pilus assembly protein TadB